MAFILLAAGILNTLAFMSNGDEVNQWVGRVCIISGLIMLISEAVFSAMVATKNERREIVKPIDRGNYKCVWCVKVIGADVIVRYYAKFVDANRAASEMGPEFVVSSEVVREGEVELN